MKRHAHSEGGDAPAEGRELRCVDLPPSNRIHGMRRERNEVAGDPVQQDLVPFEEREDTIERVQVGLDQFPKAQRCGVAEATRPARGDSLAEHGRDKPELREHARATEAKVPPTGGGTADVRVLLLHRDGSWILTGQPMPHRSARRGTSSQAAPGASWSPRTTMWMG